MLKYPEIFEFLKIASAHQTDPYRSLVQMAEETQEALNMRPTQWVKNKMGVLLTVDVQVVTQRNAVLAQF